MKKIITIEREYGAGGRTIGRRVAKELGIAFYDRDIILQTAIASHKLDPEQVRKWDERVPSSFGFAQSLFNAKPLDEELWEAQKDAIRTMANRESCVIVGRNSDYILREYDHCLHVFIHGSFDWRVKRMAEQDHVTVEQAAAEAKRQDRSRKRYCEYYTGRNYGDSRNFDLTINVEKMGVERTIRMILDAAAWI